MPLCYTINWNYIIIAGIILAVASYISGLISGYLLSRKSKELKIKVEGDK